MVPWQHSILDDHLAWEAGFLRLILYREGHHGWAICFTFQALQDQYSI